MKRSEMTKLMAENWLGLFPNEIPEDHIADVFVEVQDKMGDLLHMLEYRGMLPPSIKNPKFTCGHHIHENSYFINEWEPEDET